MTKFQKICNKLNEMNLSERAQDFIAQCDQYAIVDIFGNVETENEVEEIVNEYSEDENELTQKQMDIIASYMDDDIREDLHAELAPCEPIEFLEAYLERDPSFAELLKSEFDIEL